MDKPKKRLFRILVFFLLFLIIFLVLMLFFRSPETPPVRLPAVPAFAPDTVKAEALDTAPPAVKATPQRPLPAVPAPPETAAGEIPDTAGPPPVAAPVSPRDTTPPYVYADPGPGIHYGPIQVKLQADEPAVIEYHLDDETAWKVYADPIRISDFTFVFFRGRDLAGNQSPEVIRGYIIQKDKAGICPPDMVFIESGKDGFCMDRYEWPNRKGERPLGFVNWYMAYDSCRTTRKRLCTAPEWETACMGKPGYTFPYGNAYEKRTCNTEKDNVEISGRFVECRSYYGVHDMSGNLREWTATRSAKNRKYYQVYGGYWASRGATACVSSQYSFFPENKFIAVGFRCCKDVK
jgi:hypothetical protein